jgi:predicted RecB family nuclease
MSKEMPNFITADLTVAYTQCERKAFLSLFVNSQAVNHDYISIIEELTRKFKERYLQNLLEQNSNAVSYSIEKMVEGQSILVNANLERGDIQAFVDVLTPQKNNSIEQTYYYEPTILVGTHKISNEQIIRLNFVGYILSIIQQQELLRGIIVTADNRTHSIKIDGADKKILPILSVLRDWQYSQKTPPAILNKHCQYCKFRIDCREKASQADHISLIREANRKEIELYNKRGIFTVTQLSYTYRPRKVKKSSSLSTPRYCLSLKALSIREQKIHIVQEPRIDLQETAIFLDVEGIPDRNFYYLIGVLIKNGSHFQKTSLWADDELEEKNIWKKFLGIVQQYEQFSLIHYGSYELDFINKMSKKYPNNDNNLIEHIKASSINVLSLIYANIYFPTYSNSLKDIGMFLGVKWSDETASGLQSLVWRYKWETTGDDIFKEKLIEYNIQDCFATDVVFKTIIGILQGDNATCSKNLSIVLADDTNSIRSWRKFRKNKFVLEDMESINQCAYFDYQREKVFFREKRQRKRLEKKKTTFLYLKTHPTNKEVEVPFPKLCPRCSQTNLVLHTIDYKTVFDLKFFQHGIKRWITKYITRRVKCQSCHATFYSDDYLKIQGKYGRELKVWIVHQLVAQRQSYGKVLENLESIFGYHLEERVAIRAKSEMADYYTETYEIILSKLKTGKLVQVDETTVSIKGINCYVSSHQTVW